MTKWEYVTFNEKDGLLYDEEGKPYIMRRFKTWAEAEDYLIENDLRATIK